METLTDVSSIIDSSRNIDGYEKAVLKKLFYKLEENQKNVFKEIESEVSKQLGNLHTKKENWHITTALIDSDKCTIDAAKRNGFYEVIPLDVNEEKMPFTELNVYRNDDPDVQRRGNVYAGIVFLNCKYSEIGCYKKDYYAIVHTSEGDLEVKYNLIPYEGILEYEKKLERAALQYGINVPLIYSPMSRRAMIVKVDIDASFVEKKRDHVIDFLYEKNQLNGVILNKKTMVWNVKTEEKERLPRPKENVDKSIIPLFDSAKIVYTFDANDNEYFYVQSENIDIWRNNNKVYLGIDSIMKIDSIDYERFTICYGNPDFIGKNDLFENNYDFECCLKERVRTKGDILNILSCFDLKCEDVYFSGKQDTIRTYEKRCTYHYPKDDVLKSSSVVYVKIQGSKDLYFEDHISYVFSYLNYYYPEFRWVGVY